MVRHLLSNVLHWCFWLEIEFHPRNYHTNGKMTNHCGQSNEEQMTNFLLFFSFCVFVWNFSVVVLCVNIQNDDFYLLFSLLWITNWDNWRWPFVGIVSYAYQSTILYALFFGSFELDFLKEQKKYQRFACVWILWAPIFMVMNVWMCVCGAIVVAATGNHYHCHCHCQCCSHAPYHLNPYGQRLDVTIQCLIFYIVTYYVYNDRWWQAAIGPPSWLDKIALRSTMNIVKITFQVENFETIKTNGKNHFFVCDPKA